MNIKLDENSYSVGQRKSLRPSRRISRSLPKVEARQACRTEPVAKLEAKR